MSRVDRAHRVDYRRKKASAASMVFEVPLLRGSKPVEHTGRYALHADVICSPGADRSGLVDNVECLPREE